MRSFLVIARIHKTLLCHQLLEFLPEREGKYIPFGLIHVCNALTQLAGDQLTDIEMHLLMREHLVAARCGGVTHPEAAFIQSRRDKKCFGPMNLWC